MKRLRRLCFFLLLSPIIAICLFAFWHGWVNWRADLAVRKLLADLEARGIATTIEDFYPPVAVPGDDMMQHPALIREFSYGEYGGLKMIDSLANRKRIPGLATNRRWQFERRKGTRLDVRRYFDPVRHETEQEAARELLDAMQPEIERIDALSEAFSRPQAGFTATRVKRGSSDTYHLSLGQHWGFCAISDVTARLAEIELALGDVESAMKRVRALMSLERHLTGSPSTFSNAIGTTLVHGQIKLIIDEGIRRGLWNEEHLAEFEAHVADDAISSMFVECLKGEMTMGADMLRQRLKGQKREPHDWLEGWTWEPRGCKKRLQEAWMHAEPRGAPVLRMVGEMEVYMEVGLQDQGAPRTRFDIREMAAFQATSQLKDLEQLATVGKWYFNVRAVSVLLRTGIALERYRLSHGSHPAALGSLIPDYLTEVPVDPYDGMPLKYRVRDDGSPLVWSISRDGIDQGGMPTRNFKDGDLIWATAPVEDIDVDDR